VLNIIEGRQESKRKLSLPSFDTAAKASTQDDKGVNQKTIILFYFLSS
jgi:hypothetical protein